MPTIIKPWLQYWINQIVNELDIKPEIVLEEVISKKIYNEEPGYALGRRIIIRKYPGIPRDEVRWVTAHELRHVWQNTKYKRNSLWLEADRDRLIKILIEHEKRNEKSMRKAERYVKQKRARTINSAFMHIVMHKYHDILPEEVDAIVYANSKIRRP